MEAAQAYEFAERLGSLGIRYFPSRTAKALTEVAVHFLRLDPSQAETVLEVACMWKEWRIEHLVRLVNTILTVTPKAQDDIEITAGPLSTLHQELVGIFGYSAAVDMELKISQESETEAAQVPSDTPEYRQAESQAVDRLRRFGAHERTCREPFLERNVRDHIAADRNLEALSKAAKQGKKA